MKTLCTCLVLLLLAALSGCAGSSSVKVKGEMQHGVTIEHRT